MLKLARITTQKNNKQRYNIYLHDGKKEYYAFSLDEAILVKHMLRKDMELEESFINTLMEEDTVYKAYASAIHFLSYRMRSEKEVYDYLVEKEYEEMFIPQVMERLIKEKLLDDLEFSLMFVRTRINTSQKGPLTVKRELIKKGVASSSIEDAIGLYTYEVQYEKAKKTAEKKMKQRKKDSLIQQKQQIRAALMQSGFSGQVIQEVMNDLDEKSKNIELDEQWEALTYQAERILRRQRGKFTGFMLMNKVKEGLYRRAFPQDLINRYCDDVDWD